MFLLGLSYRNSRSLNKNLAFSNFSNKRLLSRYNDSSTSGRNGKGKQHELEEIGKLLAQQKDMLIQLMLKLERIENSNRTSSLAISKEDIDSRIPEGKSPRAFIEYNRIAEPYRPSDERIRDWAEILSDGHVDENEQKRQAARCMDCGTPFCQTHTGCPLNNLIPEWNELVLNDNWKEAVDRLHATNNFPEFTGRVCPAPCEGACVAGLVDEPVTIKNIEYAIIDRAFKEGWVSPRIVPAERRSGKRIAIVGSGPAGLACADNLNQLGHEVTVFEREDCVGGLLYYGIPNPKLDKRTVRRRVDLLQNEGINFVTGTNIGVDVVPSELRRKFDATVLAVGATKPRGLDCTNSSLIGVYYAMDFLTSNQKDLVLDPAGNFRNQWTGDLISAEGKNVVVLGAGDTGTDCIGTSLRQYCKSVVNLELLSKNPPVRNEHDNPWPQFPKLDKQDYGHEESVFVFGKDPRQYAVKVKHLESDSDGNVTALVTVQLKWKNGKFSEILDSEKHIPCDIVLLAMGFLGPEKGLTDAFQVKCDDKSNIMAQYGEFLTSQTGVFAAGDCRRGQSLVVWAIKEGRDVATSVHKYLTKSM